MFSSVVEIWGQRYNALVKGLATYNGEGVATHCLYRETSDPSGTAQNEQNDKPWTAPLVPGDQISDIIWRGSK